MFKLAATVLILLMTVGVLIVGAQEGDAPMEVDQELFAQGEELFETNCAVCHQSSGQGNPPTFPALAGNENLHDVSLIVQTVHEGRGAMPPFPQFGSEEISALATYVRNAWENDFGGVNVDDVAAQLREAVDGADTAELQSIWEGVFTRAQAERGDQLYSGNCSVCHGYLWISEHVPSIPDTHLMLVSDPEAGPSLSGQAFLNRWNGRSIGALYQFTRTTMPMDRPGSLTDQEYLDVIAFVLAVNDIPPGDQELVPDDEMLNYIVIRPGPDE